MGLLDTINNKLTGIQTNPLKMGLLAYGMTGQGNDPAGSAMSAMMQASQAKAKQDELARQKAQQAQIASLFASGQVDPSTLAQYSMGGGEGAKDLLDLYKFGRTPQSVSPGQMMIDPTTGKMSMPAPKMGEGQMWNGQQVTNAPGYLQAYGAQKAVDAQNAIDQYAAQQGIGYQYDLGRMGAQNQYDWNKMQANQAFDWNKMNAGNAYDWSKMNAQNQFDIDKTGMQNQYDWNKMQAGNQFELDKMGAQQQFDVNNYAYQDQLKARGDMTQVYNPQTGAMEYMPRSAVMQGGYMASKPDAAKQAEKQADQWNEGQTKSAQEYVKSMRDQSTNNASLGQKLNALSDLSNKIAEGKVGAFRSYLGSFAPNLGIDPTINDKQQFEAIINSIIPTLRVPGSGTFTDKDAEIMAKSLPQLSGTAEGRAKILSDLKDKVAMQNAENDAMESYIQRYGKLDDRYYQLRNDFYKAWGK